MRSVAIIDNRDATTMAIWITSRVAPTVVAHVNAVVVDLVSDLRGIEKARLLTRERAVLVTDGSTLEGLPIVGAPMMLADISTLVAETEALQRKILDAVAAFASRPDPKTGRVPAKPRKIVAPEFAASARAEDFRARETTPPMRALAAANYLARAWTLWLETDDERRRRAVDSRGRPWMMPPELASPVIAELPSSFEAGLITQPLD